MDRQNLILKTIIDYAYSSIFQTSYTLSLYTYNFKSIEMNLMIMTHNFLHFRIFQMKNIISPLTTIFHALRFQLFYACND